MQQNQGLIQEIEAPVVSYQFRKFIIQKQIGQGAQGSVFFVKSKNWGIQDQNDFALKYSFLNNVGEAEIKFIEQIIQYQNSQNEVNFPCNMIKIFDNFTYNQQYNITIMEKGDIDLYQFLNQNRNKLTYEEKLQICIDITRPIYFLHQKKLVHRDIKPENYIKVGNVFKLIDFGCVRKSTFTKLKTIGVGTPLFQAPEIVDNKQNYSDKVDVWALACVFYEIFNQDALFNYDNLQVVKQKILNHNFNQSEVNEKINQLNCNQELQNLMKAMLHPKEDQRLDSKDVLERLINIKNPPKKVNPFPFQNQVIFQQEHNLNGNKQEQKFQQQQMGGRFQTQSNINPQQFQQQIQQNQFPNQFPNFQTKFDEKMGKLEIKLMEEMKNQIQNQNVEILNKFNLQEEKQKQFQLYIEENLKKFQEYQTNQEDKNNQFISTTINKLNDQYSNLENKIIKLVNEKIEHNNRQIQQSEQNKLQKIEQQYNKEIEQLKLENSKRDNYVQQIFQQLQNELNNKQQLTIKQLEQQQENNKQQKSIETQNLQNNITQIKQCYDQKIVQLEKAQNQIQQQFNQSLQNQAQQINNQMISILEQHRNYQFQEVEAIKQQMQIINENMIKLKNETGLKISQFEEIQKVIYKRTEQTHDDLNQNKEKMTIHIKNNFEQQNKQYQQELFKIMEMNDQKFYQFKQEIERLSQILNEQKQILQTQVENNKIFNPLQINNVQNASQFQKDVYMNYNQILEQLSKTQQEILYLNQQIIGLELFTNSYQRN